MNPDYGIDEQVEVFEKGGPATGLMFLAQIRATDKPELEAALAVTFKAETLHYYRTLSLPVMMVRFHSLEKKFYWRWFHEFRERPKEGAETVTLKIPRTAQWTDQTPSEIIESLKVFRQLKSPTSSGPAVFSISIPEIEIHGTPSSLIKSAILDLASPMKGVLRLTEEVPLGAHPEIVVSSEGIFVGLAGLYSVTISMEPPCPGRLATTKLAHDVLIAVAFVLSKAGWSSQAAEIACNHLDQGTLADSPDVFSELLGAIAKSLRIPDAVRLAQRLLRMAGKPELVQWLLMLARLHTSLLQDSELEYLREVMQMFIERAKELGDSQLAAVGHYNLGNHLRGQGWPYVKAAFTQYRLAAKADSGYLQRPYFWQEIGGVLYLLGRFELSTKAYGKAIQLGAAASCMALLADSLMFSGKFREALESFRGYLEADREADAEWHLKTFMLAHLVDVLEIERQKRDARLANKLADVGGLSTEDVRARLEEAIRADALCSFAWFNTGAMFGSEGRSQDAFRGYLFAALCRPDEMEAWSRALFHSLNSHQSAFLTVCLTRTAYRWNGQAFLQELYKLAQGQAAGFPIASLMNIIVETVKDIDRTNRVVEVREVGEGANSEIKLRAPKPS